VSGEFINVPLIECVITLCRHTDVPGAEDVNGVVSKPTTKSRYGGMSSPN
jgi:hypothetical protein